MPPVISQPVPSLPTANLPAKLFVGQIPRTCNEATIRTLFQQFGEVSEIYMMKDKSTNGHKGAAFVTFVDMAAAQMAIKHLDKQYHLAQQKKPLQVRLADSPAMGQGYQATDPFAFAKQAAMAAMKLQAQTNSPQKSKRKQCPPRLDQKVFVTMQDGQVAVFSPSGRFDGHFYPGMPVSSSGTVLRVFVVFRGPDLRLLLCTCIRLVRGTDMHCVAPMPTTDIPSLICTAQQ